MADISNLITKIRNAIYGRDVRSAIADALSTLNDQIGGFLPTTGGIITGLLRTHRIDVDAFTSTVSNAIIFKTHPSDPIADTAVSIRGENYRRDGVDNPVLVATRVNSEGIGTDLARMQCAEPVANEDVVTKYYCNSQIDSKVDGLYDLLPLRITFRQQLDNTYRCDYFYSNVRYAVLNGQMVAANIETRSGGLIWYCSLLRYDPQSEQLMFSNGARFNTPEQGMYGASVVFNSDESVSVAFDEP